MSVSVSVITVNRVIGVLSPSEQPIGQLAREAGERSLLLDATHSKKVGCLIPFDVGPLMVVATIADAIAGRLAIPSTLCGEKVVQGSI